MTDLRDKFLKKYSIFKQFPKLIKLKSNYSILDINLNDAERVLKNEEPYIATTVFIPPEVLTAFGEHFIPIEQFGATSYQVLSSDKRIKNVIDDMKAEYFVKPNLCSINPALIGALHYNLIPVPKFILASSHQCDDSLKCMEFLGKKYNIDVFTLDIPFNRNKDSLDYVASQLKEMVEFISNKTGKTLDEDNFVEVIKCSNEANSYRKKISQLLSENPQLLKLCDYLPIYPLYTKLGRNEVLQVYKTLYSELKQMANSKMYPYSNQEFRIIWLGAIPLTNARFLSYIENDLKLGITAAEMFFHAECDFMDESKPYESIAHKLMMYHTVGSVNNRTARIKKLISDFKIDGAIHFSHVSCCDFNGGVRFIHDMCKNMDLPFVELNADAGNRNNFSVELLKTKMEAFAEILKNRNTVKYLKVGS